MSDKFLHLAILLCYTDKMINFHLQFCPTFNRNTTNFNEAVSAKKKGIRMGVCFSYISVLPPSSSKLKSHKWVQFYNTYSFQNVEFVLYMVVRYTRYTHIVKIGFANCIENYCCHYVQCQHEK